MTTEEVLQRKAAGYRPVECIDKDPALKAVMDLFRAGYFCPEDPSLFAPLLEVLLRYDEYMVMADFTDYVACQQRVSALYRDPDTWSRKAILNLARMGRFSSDRTILEYNRDVWHAAPVPITLSGEE